MPPPASPTLGQATRIAAFDFVWTTVNERYYDPAFNGVDWTAARERWAPARAGRGHATRISGTSSTA